MRKHLVIGSAVAFILLWVAVICVSVGGAMAWDHQYKQTHVTQGFPDVEEPRREVSPRLESSMKMLRGAGFEVKVAKHWVQDGDCLLFHITFRRGWVKGAGGEIHVTLQPDVEGVSRQVDLLLGGPEEESTELDDLGMELESLLRFG